MEKKSEKKVEEKKSTETLAQKLNAIAAKNSQIVAVRNMQQEKEKLKDKIGRKKSSGSSTKIQGLEGLRPGLGQQFIK
jgi:hypothetical protein